MRLLRALGAIVVGFGVGLWLVERLQLVALLKAPIASYLPSGKLTFTSPTEPLMIVFKLGFVVGLLLASPVLIYQAWAFLSPALYDRERKVVFPALVAGLGLFLSYGIVADHRGRLEINNGARGAVASVVLPALVSVSESHQEAGWEQGRY